MIEVKWQIGSCLFDHLFVLVLGLNVLLRELPVSKRTENIDLFSEIASLNLAFVQDLFHNPFVPPFGEGFKHVATFLFGAHCMVDGVNRNQLQVLQSPLVRQRGDHVVHCAILQAEFSGIVRVDRNRVPQTQQNRS